MFWLYSSKDPLFVFSNSQCVVLSKTCVIVQMQIANFHSCDSDCVFWSHSCYEYCYLLVLKAEIVLQTLGFNLFKKKTSLLALLLSFRVTVTGCELLDRCSFCKLQFRKSSEVLIEMQIFVHEKFSLSRVHSHLTRRIY